MRTHNIALSGLLICLSLGGLALTGAGCAGTNYHRSTGAYLDDKGIGTRVKTALFRDPLVSGFDTHVNTFRGDVQLSGFVDTPEQKERAAQIARGVTGVRMVSNNLEVKPGANTAVGTSGSTVSGSSGTISQPVPEQPAADQNIRPSQNLAPVRSSSDANQSSGAINNQSSGTSSIPAPAPQNTTAPQQTQMVPSFQINAENGRATLRGTVASDAQKRDMERRVWEIPGIQSVDNQLDVQSPR
jgi:hyperosmotically inducible periplasmic protein